MELINLNTQLINWESILPTETKGKTGVNTAREFSSNGYRIRLSVYSTNYETAEWCEKGHILHCIEGSLTLKFKNRSDIQLIQGKSLLLSENDHHMAFTGNEPAKIFIID